MAMNAQMNMPQLQQIMRQFEMQSEQLEMKQEMMEDAMDSALDEGDVDEEADGLVQQVFDEIGIDMADTVCFACPPPTDDPTLPTPCDSGGHRGRLARAARQAGRQAGRLTGWLMG
eukprot:COSAG01_NODE_4489_length_4981_cov_1.951454_2_plen_116_part_00